HLRARFSQPYVGHWVVARGDTLTLPELGDRFKLTDVILDSARVAVSGTCRFKGALVFAVPRAETLAVTWYGSPEQALIYGCRVVGGGDRRPRRASRRLGQSRSRGAAPRYRERRDSPDHPHPHSAAHGPHPGALHPGRERDFGRPGGLAHAGVLAHRAVGRDPHVHRCGADELVRLRIRRRLRPDRALPPHRSDGPPAPLNDERRVAEDGGGWWRLTS